MKNLFKFIGITALAAVIVFSMAACDNGGGGGTTKKETPPNTDPKTIVITGISAEDKTDYFPTSGYLVIYPEGTTPAQVIADQVASVGGAMFSNSDITISNPAPHTYTIPLWNPGTSSGRWTRNGTYEVGVVDGTTNPATAKAKMATVTFDEKTETVAWSSFVIPSL
jgi:hypothetical protein